MQPTTSSTTSSNPVPYAVHASFRQRTCAALCIQYRYESTRRRLIALICIFTLGMCNIVLAGTVNCAKAHTQVKKLICNDKEISELDKELAAIHKIVIDNDNTIRKTELVVDRDNWFKVVRDKCGDVACLRAKYTDRLDKLAVVRHWGSEEPMIPVAHYVVNQNEFLQQKSAFQQALNSQGLRGKLANCMMMISLDETTGSAHDTGYGIICELNHRGIMACNDTMIGKLTVKFQFAASGDNLVTFTENNCPPGG